ncbi:hypothetical protein IJT17_00240 [bacterium]|nr:hypothetical protein [bacterium]
MPRVFLLDTMFLIFRSFYALPDSLTNARGVQTGAVLGVFKAIQHLMRTERVTHCVAAFESPSPTFRLQLDGEYKANRKPAPQPLKDQIPIVADMLKHLGIRTISVPGYEADDILAALAKKLSADGEAVIVSNDKDLAQVLQYPRISLWHLAGKKGDYQRLGSDDIPQVYGVRPEQIPAWLALKGDSSDNIIGVKGIGDKTAAQLLNAHTLEELVSDPSAGGKRYGEKLVAERERVMHNLELTKVRYDLPLPDDCDWNGVALRVIDVEAARSFFADQQMKQAVSAFDCMMPADPTLADLLM